MHVLLNDNLKPACITHILNTCAMLYTFTNIFIPHRVKGNTGRQIDRNMKFETTFCSVVYLVQYEFPKKLSKSLKRYAMLPHWSPCTLKTHWRQISTKGKNWRFIKWESSTASFKETEWSDKGSFGSLRIKKTAQQRGCKINGYK